MLNKKPIHISIVVVVLAAALVLAGCSGNNPGANDPAVSGGTIGQVSSLTVTDKVETSGTLSADQLSKLTWSTTGVVDSVHVQAGDQVKAGDVLAAVKADSVPASVIQAQADLAASQQALDDLLNSGTPAAQAQLALVNAQDALTDAQNTVDRFRYKRASQEQVENAQANLTLAQDQQDEAFKAYQRFKNYPADDPRRAQAYTTYYAAQKSAQSAQSTLNWLTGGPTDSEVALADADLAVAQAAFDDAQREWERLKDGPDAVDLAAAEARVAAAQATVNGMYIIAPFDGQVLAVETTAGDPVEADEAAIVVVNPNTLKVEALVDETEISQVSAGDPAEITMDAMPGTSLTGKVALIDPIGQSDSGLVKYTVFVAVDPTDQPVLYGATTDVTLLTSDPRTMLAVPLGAVQNDTQGEYVLRYAADGSLERVNVESDTVSDDLVTISGELHEGDQVFVGTLASTSNNQGGFFGGPGGGTVVEGP
jgi:HlyD family secretion protein